MFFSLGPKKVDPVVSLIMNCPNKIFHTKIKSKDGNRFPFVKHLRDKVQDEDGIPVLADDEEWEKKIRFCKLVTRRPACAPKK